ncbi:hypothetical protein ACFY12_04615 [Streptomyces sp. NPDC001339]|uniref:hypothetical protein n=1 Tax=Streptomyces sp. NPDC001339 TaxID=3364563 RepID=UPI0036B54BC6
MPTCTARLVEAMLRGLLRAARRHRWASALPAARCEDAPTLVLSRMHVRHAGPLRGEDSALIRPYVLSPEEQRERRAQRERRRVLWLASRGIDAGPRWIHGVEVVG